MIIVIIMEILSWLFVFIVPGSTMSMKYLMIQSYFVFLMLFSALWIPKMIIFGMLFKMGLPPFQTWLLHFCSLLSGKSFAFMMTVHKFLPLVFLGKCLSFYGSLLLMAFLMGISAVFLFQSCLFFTVLLWSSMVHSIWMMLCLMASKLLMSVYWALYSIMLMVLVSSSSFSKVLMLMTSQGTLSMTAWLVISGIPPFAFFWFKTNILLVLLKFSLFYGFLMILSSILALSIYFWAFHISLLGFSYSPVRWWLSPLLLFTLVLAAN